jgi:hypothetical protein
MGREGYADYVGKGNAFNYVEARKAFLAEEPEMDYKKSGLYWRFNLLVAYLLDHRGWNVSELLQKPPSQEGHRGRRKARERNRCNADQALALVM